MLFNSLTFLVFFGLVFGLHQLPISWKGKKWNLLVASYLFYAAWNPPFVALLWFSTIVDWFMARKIAKSTGAIERKFYFALSLIAGLGVLGFFKYANFALENFISLLHLVHIEYKPLPLDIILPAGISFYTFQTLSYTFDVYRGRLKPWPSFLDYALYVTFFPQLVAGPILRADDFLPQCMAPKQANGDQVGWGLSLLLFGLFQKVVLADYILARAVDAVYAPQNQGAFLDAWAGTLAFSAQIFYDFSGYSLCAIGTALCLGFTLPDNFRFPYGALGFSDFWRRWHISLSTWLRDYLYIPMGGNRKGRSRTYLHLMMTMLIGGLWHGAGWGFVIWGGLHGIYLAGERMLRRLCSAWTIWRSRWSRIGLILMTYFFVCIAWVFFRAETTSFAWRILKAMFMPSGQPVILSYRLIGLVFLINGLLLFVHGRLRDSSLEEAFRRFPNWLRVIVLSGLIFILLVTPGENRAFIYFQF